MAKKWAAALILISSPAWAAELKSQPLAKITSDRDGGTSRLSAMVDAAGAIKKIRFATAQGTTSFDMRDISSSRGVVLFVEQGYEAVLLRGSVDGRSGKGRLVVSYLADAFSRRYGACPVDVLRSSAGQWQLSNVNTRRVVTKLEVRSHPTGIMTIKGICP